jgi:hypothetical protein
MSTGEQHLAEQRGLALLGEVLLVGVFVLVAALPVVTVLAAVAAGCAVLRAFVEERTVPTVRGFLEAFLAALRDPIAWLAPLGLLVIAGLDTLALLGGVPGGTVLGPIVGAALAAVTVAGLRGAARRPPGRTWAVAALAAGFTALRRDRSGSVLLAVALVFAAVMVAQLPVLGLLVPGLLVFATVAVERRRRSPDI